MHGLALSVQYLALVNQTQVNSVCVDHASSVNAEDVLFDPSAPVFCGWRDPDVLDLSDPTTD